MFLKAMCSLNTLLINAYYLEEFSVHIPFISLQRFNLQSFYLESFVITINLCCCLSYCLNCCCCCCFRESIVSTVCTVLWESPYCFQITLQGKASAEDRRPLCSGILVRTTLLFCSLLFTGILNKASIAILSVSCGDKNTQKACYVYTMCNTWNFLCVTHDIYFHIWICGTSDKFSTISQLASV